MPEKLNAFIDVVKARRDYRDFQWARIDDFVDKVFAERIIQNMVRNVAFKNVFAISGEKISMTDPQLNELEQGKRQILFKQIHAEVHNVESPAFLFAEHNISDRKSQNEIGAINDIAEVLADQTSLEMFQDITGKRNLSELTCKVTRFSQGQFATKTTLSDFHICKRPELGFILDLTPEWETDWGGLLHLHSDDDLPTQTFTPKFNNFIIFDAKFPLSISYLAPFIKYYKYALMGCFSSVDS